LGYHSRAAEKASAQGHGAVAIFALCHLLDLFIDAFGNGPPKISRSRLLPRTESLEESRENMARKDKVLTHYREQLKLNEDALRGHAEGRNDDKEVAKLKHSIAKLKAIIQAHEQKVKHG